MRDSMAPKDSTQVTWLRILRLDSGSWLGLVGTSLYIGDELAPKRRLDAEVPTGLLPCLERSYEDVTAELQAGNVNWP